MAPIFIVTHITKMICLSLIDYSHRETRRWKRDRPGGAERESKPAPDTKGSSGL